MKLDNEKEMLISQLQDAANMTPEILWFIGAASRSLA